jgi:hypothetical protein
MAYELGLGGVQKDVLRARMQYTRDCSLRLEYLQAPRRRPTFFSRDPLSCYRLASIIERGEAPDDLRVAADLYGDACLNPGDGYPSVRGAACTRAAALELEHGWDFRPRINPGFDFEPTWDAAPYDFASIGCRNGALGSCGIVKRMFDEREARGEWFDLRDD